MGFTNLSKHIKKLKNSNKIPEIFISNIRYLNKQLDDGIHAHHPFMGVDKAKYLIQINNNPDNEYVKHGDSWYKYPHKEEKFDSIDELANHINSQHNN